MSKFKKGDLVTVVRKTKVPWSHCLDHTLGHKGTVLETNVSGSRCVRVQLDTGEKWYYNEVSLKLRAQEPPTPARGQRDGNGEGKPQLTLIPRAALDCEAKALSYGANKYSRNNWRKGMPYLESLDSVLRHITAFVEGEDDDPESGVSHLGHAKAGLSFIIQYEAEADLKAKFDDRDQI